MGSPTEPRTRSDERSYFVTGSEPKRMSVLMVVGGEELRDLVPLHHVLVAALLRVSGHGAEHKGGARIGQRAVNDARMPGHPAHVRHASETIAHMQVEHRAESQRSVQQVAGRAVRDAFGFTRGPGRVQHEEEVLRLHLFQRTIRPHAGQDLVGPDIAAFHHVNACPGAAVHEASGHEAQARHGLVCDVLQQRDLPTSDAFVSGDEPRAPGVHDAVSQSLRGEAREDHGVDQADACGCKHAIGGLGDHGHVHGDSVTLPGAEMLEHVRRLAHLHLQLTEAHPSYVRGLVALEHDGRARGCGLGPPVNTIVASVQ
mmetsp:Transcript_51875/g.150998  ORF Transcript_51875/g.150998 Transcript_51875/m.150998 type:complete len:314 (+) Transcript_51875:1344-2285(+)